MQGDLKYMHSYTAVCHGRNAILILFLRHFEAHTLPFSVRFQHRPGLIAHFWNLEHRLNIFPLRSQQKQRQKYLEFVVTGQVCVALIDILPLWLNPTKNKSHGVRLGLHGGNFICPPRPIHGTGNSLSGRSRTGSPKCGGAGAPSCMTSNSFWLSRLEHGRHDIVKHLKHSRIQVFISITLYAYIHAFLAGWYRRQCCTLVFVRCPVRFWLDNRL